MNLSVADQIRALKSEFGLDVNIIYDDQQFQVTLWDHETNRDEGWYYSFDLSYTLQWLLEAKRSKRI